MTGNGTYSARIPNRVRVMNKITRQQILNGDYKGRIRVRKYDKWEDAVPLEYRNHLLFDGRDFAHEPKEGEVILVNEIKTRYTENEK